MYFPSRRLDCAWAREQMLESKCLSKCFSPSVWLVHFSFDQPSAPRSIPQCLSLFKQWHHSRQEWRKSGHRRTTLVVICTMRGNMVREAPLWDHLWTYGARKISRPLLTQSWVVWKEQACPCGSCDPRVWLFWSQWDLEAPKAKSVIHWTGGHFACFLAQPLHVSTWHATLWIVSKGFNPQQISLSKKVEDNVSIPGLLRHAVPFYC